MRASILKNTNRAVSSSEESWGSLRENTMVKFGNDSEFYKIGSSKQFMFIKNFKSINQNQILIEDDIGIALNVLDTVQVSFKEYELLTVIKEENRGSKYKVGDLLTIAGGIPSKDTQTNIDYSTKLVVSEVGADGEILQIRLEHPGKYICAPEQKCNLIGGHGSGATVLADFVVSDHRYITERTVTRIDKNEKGTIITLDSKIDSAVTDGKISVTKWELFITSNYAGESKYNEQIQFIRDFSPNLGIPFLLKDNQSPEAIYNLAILKIDSEFTKLQNRIKELESRIRG